MIRIEISRRKSEQVINDHIISQILLRNSESHTTSNSTQFKYIERFDSVSHREIMLSSLPNNDEVLDPKQDLIRGQNQARSIDKVLVGHRPASFCVYLVWFATFARVANTCFRSSVLIYVTSHKDTFRIRVFYYREKLQLVLSNYSKKR